MSNYKCWVKDFPKRSLKLLKKLENQAYKDGLEVTLLLSIASATICIPNDRLLEQSRGRPLHLDSKHEPESTDSINDLLKSKIRDIGDEKLINILSAAPYGRLEQPSIGTRPDSGWDDYRKGCNENKYFGTEKQFGSLIKHIRNALAHGNIYTLSKRGQINELVLLNSRYNHKSQKPTDDYDYLTITPSQLKDIISCWVNGLAGLNFNPEEISYAISRQDDVMDGAA